MNKPTRVILSPLIYAILPFIILVSFRKKVLAFTMMKGKSELYVGMALIPASIVIGRAFYFLVGGYSYPLVFWVLGGVGIMMVVHSLSPGLIFVKPMCNACTFLPLIMEHENLHISGIHGEVQVWSRIKEKYDWKKIRKPQKICPHCPIPGHMQAKD